MEDSGVGVVGLETGVEELVSSPCFFSICGGRSVVECLPVVQGGIERNSSKVKTRGLQHFQPGVFVLADHLRCVRLIDTKGWGSS